MRRTIPCRVSQSIPIEPKRLSLNHFSHNSLISTRTKQECLSYDGSAKTRPAMPKLVDIHKRRRCQEAYSNFCYFFVQKVVGASHFKSYYESTNKLDGTVSTRKRKKRVDGKDAKEDNNKNNNEDDSTTKAKKIWDH